MLDNSVVVLGTSENSNPSKPVLDAFRGFDFPLFGLTQAGLCYNRRHGSGGVAATRHAAATHRHVNCDPYSFSSGTMLVLELALLLHTTPHSSGLPLHYRNDHPQNPWKVLTFYIK